MLAKTKEEMQEHIANMIAHFEIIGVFDQPREEHPCSISAQVSEEIIEDSVKELITTLSSSSTSATA